MEITQTIAAFITPVIAVITTYIAVQQHRINRLRVKLDVFDKRYELYQGVKEFILFAVHKGNVSDEAISSLNEKAQDAFFLCGIHVEEYIGELRSKGARLMHLVDQIELIPPGSNSERSRFTKEAEELRVWFGEQLGNSKRVFRRYLGL